MKRQTIVVLGMISGFLIFIFIISIFGSLYLLNTSSRLDNTNVSNLSKLVQPVVSNQTQNNDSVNQSELTDIELKEDEGKENFINSLSPFTSFTVYTPKGWNFEIERKKEHMNISLTDGQNEILIKQFNGGGMDCIFEGEVIDESFQLDLKDVGYEIIDNQFGELRRYKEIKSINNDQIKRYLFCGPSFGNGLYLNNLTKIGYIEYFIGDDLNNLESLLHDMDAIIASIKLSI